MEQAAFADRSAPSATGPILGILLQAGHWALLPAWYHAAFLALGPGSLRGGRLRATERERAWKWEERPRRGRIAPQRGSPSSG